MGLVISNERLFIGILKIRKFDKDSNIFRSYKIILSGC